jgi:hypothetical protein
MSEPRNSDRIRNDFGQCVHGVSLDETCLHGCPIVTVHAHGAPTIRVNSDRDRPAELASDLRTRLSLIASIDVETLIAKDLDYGSSWKKRGGIGAFMMLARKWDRLEKAVEAHGWDVFAAARGDERVEGIRDDLADLRRYLLLVETELLER